MRIISQNRDTSVEFDNVILKICNGSLIYAYPYANQSSALVLGKYESNERTREVFDDIHNAYSPYKLIHKEVSFDKIPSFFNLNNIMVPAIEKSDIDFTSICDSVVYYMPEE